jgi:hypothetical protein
MTSAALPLIGGKLHKAVAVTNAENAVPIDGVAVITAVPDPWCVKLVYCTGRKNTFML